MVQAHRRHDISDKVWQLLEPHLPGLGWGIIVYLSMLFSGSCAPVGVIYRQI